MSGTAYTAAASGNWSATGTWSPSGVPGTDPADTITSLAGYTVTVDTSPTLTSIAFSTGYLYCTSTRTITLSGNPGLTYSGTDVAHGGVQVYTGGVLTITGPGSGTLISITGSGWGIYVSGTGRINLSNSGGTALNWTGSSRGLYLSSISPSFSTIVGNVTGPTATVNNGALLYIDYGKLSLDGNLSCGSNGTPSGTYAVELVTGTTSFQWGTGTSKTYTLATGLECYIYIWSGTHTLTLTGVTLNNSGSFTIRNSVVGTTFNQSNFSVVNQTAVGQAACFGMTAFTVTGPTVPAATDVRSGVARGYPNDSGAAVSGGGNVAGSLVGVIDSGGTQHNYGTCSSTQAWAASGIIYSSGTSASTGILKDSTHYYATGIFDGTNYNANGTLTGNTTYNALGIVYGTGTYSYAGAGIVDHTAAYNNYGILESTSSGTYHASGTMDVSSVYHANGIIDTSSAYNANGILATGAAYHAYGVLDSSYAWLIAGIASAGNKYTSGIFDGTYEYTNGIFNGTSQYASGVWDGSTYHAQGIIDKNNVWYQYGAVANDYTRTLTGIVHDSGTVSASGILNTTPTYAASGVFAGTNNTIHTTTGLTTAMVVASNTWYDADQAGSHTGITAAEAHTANQVLKSASGNYNDDNLVAGNIRAVAFGLSQTGTLANLVATDSAYVTLENSRNDAGGTTGADVVTGKNPKIRNTTITGAATLEAHTANQVLKSAGGNYNDDNLTDANVRPVAYGLSHTGDLSGLLATDSAYVSLENSRNTDPGAANVAAGTSDYYIHGGTAKHPAYPTTAATQAAQHSTDATFLNTHKAEIIPGDTNIQSEFGVTGTAPGGGENAVYPSENHVTTDEPNYGPNGNDYHGSIEMADYTLASTIPSDADIAAACWAYGDRELTA